MLTIYKYPFGITETFSLTMPSVCQVLRIDHQPGTGPCLWAMVDPQSAREDYLFHVVGTGHPIPGFIHARSGHLGTFFQGPFVWHVFGPTRLMRGSS